MAASVPHRSIAAALLAVWGAVSLLALPIAVKTASGPGILAAVLFIGGFIGGVTTGAAIRLNPIPAAVGAAIAGLLLHGMKDGAAISQSALFAVCAATAAGIGAHGGRRLQWKPNDLLAALIINGVLMITASIEHQLKSAGWISDHASSAVFLALFLGGACCAALVREFRLRHAAGGAAVAVIILGGIIALLVSNLTAWLIVAILIPIAAGLASVGFLLARNLFHLGHAATEEPIPPARTLDRD